MDTHLHRGRGIGIAFLAVTAAAAWHEPLAAQCDPIASPAWLTGRVASHPGLGQVHAAIPWDPDGPGPRQSVLAVSGFFDFPGMTSHVAAFDPATGEWLSLGQGPNHRTNALLAAPNGDLIVAGRFTAVGGVPAGGIARWDGTAWHPLGTGISGSAETIDCLLFLPNGDVFAGGWFTHIGGVPAQNAARWDGVAWHPLGAGFPHQVLAAALHPSGDVYVNGAGLPGAIGKWDGATWHSLVTAVGLGLGDIVVMPNGDVIAAAGIGTPAGNTSLARWDGQTWSPHTPGLDWSIGHLTVLPNGDLLAAGGYLPSGTNIARWDGVQWWPMPRTTGYWVLAVTSLPDGTPVAVGGDASIPQQPALVEQWKDGSWRGFGDGLNGEVQCLLRMPSGELVAAGDFTYFGSQPCRAVANLVGDVPHALGQLRNPVRALAALPTGELLSGFHVGAIGKWDGAAWRNYTTAMPVPKTANALAVMPDGSLLVGYPANTTQISLARWDGSSWQSLGGGPNGPVESILVRNNGDVIIGGSFLSVGTPAHRVARWNGTTWSAMGGGFDGTVLCLAEAAGGALYAGGSFLGSATVWCGGIARWNGTAWVPLGVGLAGGSPTRAEALLRLPNGDLLVGGDFTSAGGVPTRNMARWDGQQWHAVDSGPDGPVLALALLDDGAVAVGGRFHRAGGGKAAFYTRVDMPCPARAHVLASGCSRQDGASVLYVESLPWLGGTYATRCAVDTNTLLAATVMGFAPQRTPLTTLVPGSPPGCYLLTTPDATSIKVPQGGVVRTAISLPRDTSLLGVRMQHQVLRLGPGSTPAAFTMVASNALALQIGGVF